MRHYLNLLTIFFLLSSCANSKRVTYFHNIGERATFEDKGAPEHVIQPQDILSISVSSLNKEATEVFNTPNRSDASVGYSPDRQQPSGYVVDTDGNIQFPILGEVAVKGLTLGQLQDQLQLQLVAKKLLYDPVVDVRILNFRVTVIGEVAKPQVITVPTEKITLLEALGMAGDMTVFSQRNNVMVIRDIDGKRQTQRIDLNSDELFKSPYYYLRSNDVIYVQPNKAKVFSSTRTYQLLPIIISSMTVVVIAIDRLTRE